MTTTNITADSATQSNYTINGKPVSALEYAAFCQSVIESLKPERERLRLAMQNADNDEDFDEINWEYCQADATIQECIADIVKITGETIVDDKPYWNRVTNPAPVKFSKATAKELRDRLGICDEYRTPKMHFINQRGDISYTDLCPWIEFYEGKFELTCDARYLDYSLGTYDTPEQVTTVINQLHDAIKRGDKVFLFPTVDDLSMTDSLTRAMKIALDCYKGFCYVGNLTAAESELKLYNICRKAMTELRKER